ncbi:MAG: bacteriohemerythrin, partial [Oceanospirillaceae bacterium]
MTTQQTLDIFPWNDSFNTGISEIDDQHKELVRLLNLLAKQIAFNFNILEIYDVFHKLADYTIYHFKTEEKIWDEYLPNDPLNVNHKKTHQKLIDELEQLKKQLSTSPAIEVVESLLPFLTRWLVSHIIGSDRYLATVVLLMRSGLLCEAAQEQANKQVHNSTPLMTDVILSIFRSLSSNTFLLMKEIDERTKIQKIETFRNEVMELLISNSSLNEVLEKVISEVEIYSPQSICNILLLNKEGTQFVSYVAPNLPMFYCEAINGIKIADAVGAYGTTAFTGNRVITTNIDTDPLWIEYQELAAKAGLKSCWSQPIYTISSKQIIGIFAIFHEMPFTPSDSDLQLIEQAAKLVNIAIDQDYNQQQLRIAATAFQSQEGVVITDANSVIVKVNQAYTEITGYQAEDLIGKKTSLFKSGMHPPAFYKKMWSEINNSGYWINEIWNTKKNNDAYAANLTITAVNDKDGNITHYVGTLTDISERKANETEINRLAFYDPLTQLPNRRLLLKQLNLAIETKALKKDKGALLFLDIDNFKTLNDMHGHDFGDILLKEIAKRLEYCVGALGTIGRLGGDEFVVILGKLPSGIAQAKIISNQILLKLSQPYQLKELEYDSSISIGVTVFSDDTYDASELMKQADVAMYQAKEAGGNTVRFFELSMQLKLLALAELENDLRIAIKEEQFELFYQVQVNHLGQPIGAEALIRWHHP